MNLKGIEEIIAIFNADKVSFIILFCILLFILINSFYFCIRNKIKDILRKEYERGIDKGKSMIDGVLQQKSRHINELEMICGDLEKIYSDRMDNMSYYVKEDGFEDRTAELMPERTQAIHEAISKINEIAGYKVDDADYILAKNYLHVRRCYEAFCLNKENKG